MQVNGFPQACLVSNILDVQILNFNLPVCSGAAGPDEELTQKPVKAEVCAELDMAAAAGLMPTQMDTSALPSWCKPELLQAVAGSQVIQRSLLLTSSLVFAKSYRAKVPGRRRIYIMSGERTKIGW